MNWCKSIISLNSMLDSMFILCCSSNFLVWLTKTGYSRCWFSTAQIHTPLWLCKYWLKHWTLAWLRALLIVLRTRSSFRIILQISKCISYLHQLKEILLPGVWRLLMALATIWSSISAGAWYKWRGNAWNSAASTESLQQLTKTCSLTHPKASS